MRRRKDLQKYRKLQAGKPARISDRSGNLKKLKKDRVAAKQANLTKVRVRELERDDEWEETLEVVTKKKQVQIYSQNIYQITRQHSFIHVASRSESFFF